MAFQSKFHQCEFKHFLFLLIVWNLLQIILAMRCKPLATVAVLSRDAGEKMLQKTNHISTIQATFFTWNISMTVTLPLNGWILSKELLIGEGYLYVVIRCNPLK